MPEQRNESSAASSPRRWKVTLYEGGFVVDAESEHEARVEALQAVAESLDLFMVEPDTATRVRYEGEFELAWLGEGERVMSAGDGTGAAIIVSPDGRECRVEVGDEISVPR